MDADWWSQYLDGQVGQPVWIEKTATEITWRMTLPDLQMVIVIHGSRHYLGCAVHRVPIPTPAR